VLNNSGIINIGETAVPYLLFALTGITIWQFFSSILVNTSNSLINAGSMITKINFPKFTLVFAAAGQSIVELLIRFIFIFGLMAYYSIAPELTIIYIPFILLGLLLLGISIGMILSIITGIARDLPNIINYIMTFLMFITPVLYPENNNPIFKTLNKYNPISYFINGFRDLLFIGTYQQANTLLYLVIGTIVLFIISWRLFIIVEPRITERI
jgi:lipopolysaccharide transport system permease protein